MSEAERNPRRPRTRTLVILVTLALVAAAAFVIWNRSNDRAPLVAFEQSARVRQREALRAYAARAANGSLVPQNDALIAVRQEFVQQALDRSLPYRRYFEHGRYVARLDRADVELDSGLAQVTLVGRGMMAGGEQSDAYADF